MAKPTVSAGNATKVTDYANLVKYVSQGDIIDGSSGDTTLTASDFGRTVVVNSSSARTVYLPSVDAAEVGGWFRIVKLGSGSVTVDAADSDVIADGAAGGTLVNSVAGEVDASVLLILESSSKWVIGGGHGTWATASAIHYPAVRSTQKPTTAGIVLANEATLKEISKPSNPASGYLHLYAKSGSKPWVLNPSGGENQIAFAEEVLPMLGSRRWGGWRVQPGSTTPLYVLCNGQFGGTGGAISASSVGSEPQYITIYTQNLGGYVYYWTTTSGAWEASKSYLFDVTFRVYYETTTAVRTWVGLTDAVFTVSTDDPASRHIAVFRWNPGTNANIMACVKDGTTLNSASTGVAGGASWFTLRISASSSSQIDFYVNGALTNSLTSNLPTLALVPWISIQTLSAASAYIRAGSFFGSFNG